MSLSAVAGEVPRASKHREVTVAHTRILRTTLAIDDCYAYWQKVDTGIPATQRARVAFEERWFGLKSDARVRTLMGDMLERFDAFPEALQLLHELRTIPAALRPWLCHLHTALADPIYRQFAGVFLPERRALGYTTVDRAQVARWVNELYPERWAGVTASKFGSNLLATAFEAGLVAERRDPRPLAPVSAPEVAAERRLPTALIEKLVERVTEGFHGDVGVVPRQFLRTFVNILDLLADDAEQDAAKLLDFEPAVLSPEEEAVMAGRKLDEPPPDDGFGGSSVSM